MEVSKEDMKWQKQLPHRGTGDVQVTYANGTKGLHRSSYTGDSDHGLFTFFNGEEKFASWNMMGPCAYLTDPGCFNNPQCVVETFETYKARILGSGPNAGALSTLLRRLEAGKIGAAALQEAVFLRHTPGIPGVSQSDWDQFREKCEHYIKCAGFKILKSDALEDSEILRQRMRDYVDRGGVDSFDTRATSKAQPKPEQFFIPNNQGIADSKAPKTKDDLGKKDIKQIITHSTISLPQGRGCAILYNTKVYEPIQSTTPIPLNQGGRGYTATVESDCVSAEDRVYTRLKNKKTHEALFLTSIHLDYKKTHGDRKTSPIKFAQQAAEQLNTSDPVFIMGDWNTCCVYGNNSWGAPECTNLAHSASFDKFVFHDEDLAENKKNYDWVYGYNLDKQKRITFTADIFLPTKDGGAILVGDGHSQSSVNSGYTSSSTTSISEVGSYSIQPTLGNLALFIPIAAMAAYGIIKVNPYLSLAGTASCIALTYYKTDHTIVTKITNDNFEDLCIRFKYGTNIELQR